MRIKWQINYGFNILWIPNTNVFTEMMILIIDFLERIVQDFVAFHIL